MESDTEFETRGFLARETVKRACWIERNTTGGVVRYL